MDTNAGSPAAAETTPQVWGLWWRAARYEIRDGVIQPVPGTPVEPYDPWATFKDARSGWGGGGAAPPYAALLDLVWRIRLLPPRSQNDVRLAPESEALILRWCTEHGLLGTLLQETEVVYNAARWGNAPIGGGHHEGVLQPMRTTYTWAGSPWLIGGWAERIEAWSLPADPLRRVSFHNDDDISLEDVVPPELVAERWRPEVLLREPVSGAYTTRPLGSYWGPFFPRVAVHERSTHRYPWPNSNPWWDEYAEPVERFLEAATRLFDALTGLAEDGPRLPETGLPAPAHMLLDGLLGTVRPLLVRDQEEGDWLGAWQAKSLMASYAMMAYLDVLDGKRILACDVCGKPYVTGAYQARYCSDRCRNTALKRAYRNRRRDNPQQPSARSRD